MSHRHAHDEDGEPQKCVAIADHVCLQPIDGSNVPPGSGIPINSPEGEAYGSHLAGFLVGHDRPGLEVRCEGFVGVDGQHGNNWTMTGSLDAGDLTLSPSILCRLGSGSTEECGFHGYVREGRWVTE